MALSEALRALADRLRPARPRDMGVEERVPQVARIVGARALANEAHDLLTVRGFTDEQLRLWAESYLTEELSGDLETFLEWIASKERIAS